MKRRTKIAVGAAAALAVAGAGGAVAATQFGSPSAESEAIISDAAEQLGIEPSRLSNALKKALANRIDAAVAAGRLTKEQGEALKERIQSEDFPLIFGGPHKVVGIHGFAKLEAAASYLGMSEVELRSQLGSGKTLAQVARDRGKSVDGLVDALVAALKERLDAKVAAGGLTRAQADEILSNAREHITAFVNSEGPRGFGVHRFGGPEAGEFLPHFRGGPLSPFDLPAA